MKAAATVGLTLHRCAAEQVEYWADIGRKVCKIIDPDTLLAIQAGMAKISIEETESVSVDPDAVFETLNRDRESGALSEAIAAGRLFG